MDRRIERTRAAVVEAAVALASRGGPAMGMTEIATAAGVSRKAVYENFGSRDEVMRSATQWLLRDAVPVPGPAAPAGSGSAPEDSAWHTVLVPIVAHMTHHRQYYRSVLSAPASAAARDAVVDHAVSELHQERRRRAEPVGDPSGSADGPRDRFVAHGLVGMIADALRLRPDVDLRCLLRELAEGLTAPTPGW
ncbi:hypothetical protein KVA01_02670 [Kocuria varians]|uniref:HTH tetR-type domain-containing protein n=1 Tax=Kocuria varians TaxID=1272 RepID=A0A4Y4D168_KOCVA|nr:TetR/AcrR family transcriptional regulator [Kocuria varians]GEC98112.1 hypothetical protein KVA01_02670 [Kocuria varians]